MGRLKQKVIFARGRTYPAVLPSLGLIYRGLGRDSNSAYLLASEDSTSIIAAPPSGTWERTDADSLSQIPADPPFPRTDPPPRGGFAHPYLRRSAHARSRGRRRILVDRPDRPFLCRRQICGHQ